MVLLPVVRERRRRALDPHFRRRREAYAAFKRVRPRSPEKWPAFLRFMATQFGVKAFEMVQQGKFGRMAAYQDHEIVDVALEEAIAHYNYVDPNSYLVQVARGVGISFGD